MKIRNKLKEINEKTSQEERDLREKLNSEENVLLLKSYEDPESRKLLSSLGLDHKREELRKTENSLNKKVHLKELYSPNKIVKGEDLKELCNKYDLKLQRTGNYNGGLPKNVTEVLLEFCKRHNLLSKDGYVIGSKNFYVLAPSECFEYGKSSESKVEPLLFYLADHGSNYVSNPKDELFVQLHDWDMDFSVFRIFKTLFMDIEYGDNLSNKTMSIIGVSLIAAGIILNFFISTKGVFNGSLFVWGIYSLIYIFTTKSNESYYNENWFKKED